MTLHAGPTSEAIRSRGRGTPLVDELLLSAESGDRARFDALFELWLSVIFAESVRRLGERHSAEDLTRALLLRAVQRAVERLRTAR
jgi:hypothetical protein